MSKRIIFIGIPIFVLMFPLIAGCSLRASSHNYSGRHYRSHSPTKVYAQSRHRGHHRGVQRSHRPYQNRRIHQDRQGRNHEGRQGRRNHQGRSR